MAKNFSDRIEEIMPLVNDGSDLPFAITHENGNWNINYFALNTTASQEEVAAQSAVYLALLRESDPFAVQHTGADFAKGSFAYVYDKVLCARFRAEYNAEPFGTVHGGEFRAVLNAFEDNIGRFSQNTLDYLLGHDKPLRALYDLNPIPLYNSEKPDNEPYDADRIDEFVETVEFQIKEITDNREKQRDTAVFEYGGYHFKPYRKFRKGEIERPLAGDSREGKTDAQYAMRNMSSDFGLGISKYDWGNCAYSHAGFYSASGDSTADIFTCIENGKLYVPHENELFRYNEPQARKKAVTARKPDMLAKIGNNKQKVERDKAASTDAPTAHKKTEKEV